MWLSIVGGWLGREWRNPTTKCLIDVQTFGYYAHVMRAPAKSFLSYAAADRRLCGQLWADLRAATQADSAYDFTLWSMDDNLLAGDDWDGEVRAALDRSALGVIAVSHAMLSSNYIRDVEVKHFLDASKPLIPILLTQVNAYADLQGLQPNHVFGWSAAYEAQGSRAKRRNWATELAEELHRVLDERNGR